MALEKTIQTNTGLTANNAYHRVEDVGLTSKTTIEFCVKTYATSAADMKPITSINYGCSYDMSGGNPIAQAYTYLKTLDEYSDAGDV